MTVCEVMDHLPDGPAAGAIRKIELLVVQTSYSRFEFRRELLDFVDCLTQLRFVDAVRFFKPSHGISKIGVRRGARD